MEKTTHGGSSFRLLLPPLDAGQARDRGTSFTQLDASLYDEGLPKKRTSLPLEKTQGGNLKRLRQEEVRHEPMFAITEQALVEEESGEEKEKEAAAAAAAAEEQKTLEIAREEGGHRPDEGEGEVIEGTPDVGMGYRATDRGHRDVECGQETHDDGDGEEEEEEGCGLEENRSLACELYQQEVHPDFEEELPELGQKRPPAHRREGPEESVLIRPCLNQGLGAVLAHLRKSCDMNMEMSQVPSRCAKTTIMQIPLGVIEKILTNLNLEDLSRALASSYLFLTVSLSSCPCHQIIPVHRFVGAIFQSYGPPCLAFPERPSPRYLESAAKMLRKYMTIAYKSRHWMKILDIRRGHIIVLRDNGLDVLRPFFSRKIYTLPPGPLLNCDELITAAVIPLEREEFTTFLFSRGAKSTVNLSFLRSSTGMWEAKLIELPFVLSNDLKQLRTPIVYATKRLHILDSQRMVILAFDIDAMNIDLIHLPRQESMGSIRRQSHGLATTRDGQLCWAALFFFFFERSRKVLAF